MNIVYSTSYENANKKLTEIANEKKGNIVRSRGSIEVRTDSEVWKWVNPQTPIARAYKSTVAIIDRGCSIGDLHYVILPALVGDANNITFFDYSKRWSGADDAPVEIV